MTGNMMYNKVGYWTATVGGKLTVFSNGIEAFINADKPEDIVYHKQHYNEVLRMQTNLRFVGYRGFSLVFYDEVTRNEYVCRCDNTHLALSRGYLYSITHDLPLKPGDINHITGAYLPE